MDWYQDWLVLVPQYPHRFEGVIFTIARNELVRSVQSNPPVPVTIIEVPLIAPGLESLPGYEGIEAIVFDGSRVFVTVEARVGLNKMQSVLIPGSVSPDFTQVHLDVDAGVVIPAQSPLSNYSDESMVVVPNGLLTIYEANGANVNPQPVASFFSADLQTRQPIRMPSIEYRITDASQLDGEGIFWVINYLFPGDIKKLDPASDRVAATWLANLPPDEKGRVERLVALKFAPEGISLADIPPVILGLDPDGEARNWEGLALIPGEGFLLVTDKFPKTILAFVPFP